jgi:hypothetical protein
MKTRAMTRSEPVNNAAEPNWTYLPDHNDSFSPHIIAVWDTEQRGPSPYRFRRNLSDILRESKIVQICLKGHNREQTESNPLEFWDPFPNVLVLMNWLGHL